jgi:uncharacterized protein involved in exopolysaccharide biosynthesis
LSALKQTKLQKINALETINRDYHAISVFPWMSVGSMVGDHELNRDIDVDLGGIFGRIWRNKFKLLIISAIVTVAAFAILQVVAPRYRSEARILIRASESVLSGASATQNQSTFDDPGIASQVQLLQSRAIAQKVATALELDKRTEFDPTLNQSGLNQFLSSLGLTDDGSGVTSEDRVLESYYERLQVFQADNARVIVVQYWSEDPELAAAIPNLITQEYLSLQEELKRGANPEELEKLEPELKALRNGVMDAEAAVAEFRESSDLLQGRDNNTLATQELSELSSELTRVRSQLSRAEANAASIEKALESGSLAEASSVLQSPLIQRLRERQVTLNAQMSELSTSLLSGHPRIQRLESQISELGTQIRMETQKIEASLQREAEVARAREADLVERRNVLKSEAGRVGKAQVELRALEREADAQRQLLNTYLVRFKEAKSRQNREFLPADAFVFSKAQVQSKPYFPKKIPTLAGAFFGTLLFGSMIVLATGVMSGPAVRASYQEHREFVSQDTSAELEVPLPIVAEQAEAPPLAPAMENLLSDTEQPSSGAVSIAVAAKSVALLGHGRITVVTPEPENDRPTATQLARCLAERAFSVIVVDMTGTATSSTHMLGHAIAPGIKDLLSGSTSLGETIHCDRASSAHIMPTGNASTQAASGNASQLPIILDALQQTYDYVIVDCGNANVGGLSRVSNASTVNIIDSLDATVPFIAESSAALTMAGFRLPMIVQADAGELEFARNVVA